MLAMDIDQTLERCKEDVTPKAEQRISLYIKAGPDGISPGDCPFAHYVRMVLEEKKLPYDLHSCTMKTKPTWLIDDHRGSMPALRYDTECYVESEAICQRLDSSIAPEPSLSSYPIGLIDRAVLCTDGFFPAVARYLKHAEDGDGKDLRLRNDLELVLSKLNSHLDREERTGPYLVGDGERITLVDCALAPKLYHLSVGLIAFKGNAVDLAGSFPAVKQYTNIVFGSPSFQASSYPEDFIVWGWSDARDK